MNNRNTNFEEAMKAMKIIEGRNKIIEHNNYCILETIAFYENIFLNDIIKPFLFNENYDKYSEINKVISDRLSFMTRFKIVKKIGKIYKVNQFNKIDDFIKMRNDIAHNLSSILELNMENKEAKIFFAGKEVTWNDYLESLNKWVSLSYDIAKFAKEIFSRLNPLTNYANFMYCKLEGNCVLVQHNLIFPEPDGEYCSFFKNGFNMDLLEYVNEEQEYYREDEKMN